MFKSPILRTPHIVSQMVMGRQTLITTIDMIWPKICSLVAPVFDQCPKKEKDDVFLPCSIPVSCCLVSFFSSTCMLHCCSPVCGNRCEAHTEAAGFLTCHFFEKYIVVPPVQKLATGCSVLMLNRKLNTPFTVPASCMLCDLGHAPKPRFRPKPDQSRGSCRSPCLNFAD